MGIDRNLLIYFLACSILFYANTWETYIKGGLNLPVINFVSDGIPFLAIMLCCMSLKGYELAGKVGEVLALPAVIIAFGLGILQMISNFKVCEEYGKTRPEVFKGLIPHFFLVTFTLIWDYIEPEAFLTYPRLCLTMISLVFFRFNISFLYIKSYLIYLLLFNGIFNYK